MLTFKNRFAGQLLTAAIVLLLSGLLAETVWGRRAELLAFDSMTVLDAAPLEQSPIVVVGIDEASFGELDMQWPWPRSLHADLIRSLTKAGAAVIAFDVLFAEPTSEREDARLAQAIREAGNVVLASDEVFSESQQFQQLMEVEPYEGYRIAGAHTGLVSVSVDVDGIVRSFPTAENAFWKRTLAIYQATQGAQASGPDPGNRDPRGRLIRYLGPDHTFRFVSYYQALQAETFLPPDVFKGKIVLVGNDIKAGTGSDRQDMFLTPYTQFTGFLTPGVELHATLIENELSGRHIAEAAPLQRYGLLLGAIAIAVLLTARLSPLRGFFASTLLIVALLALSYTLFFRWNTWLPVVIASLGVFIVYFVHALTGFVRELRQRKQIEKAFKYYVSPEIVKEMTDHPEKLVLGGIRKNVTVMFTDLEGFTSFSEKKEPEEVALLLKHYFTFMSAIVLKHGGTLDKFIGDAIMALWGAPVEDPAQADHALAAVLEMLEKLPVLRQELSQMGIELPNTRIGLHTGAAIVGNMGSVDRFEFTAIGDTVNLASRLESANKNYGTNILLSAETAAGLGGEHALRAVDLITVKGRTQPVEIFTICPDEKLNERSQALVELIKSGNAAEAAKLCEALLLEYPGDKIASCHLRNIGQAGLQHKEARSG